MRVKSDIRNYSPTNIFFLLAEERKRVAMGAPCAHWMDGPLPDMCLPGVEEENEEQS